MNETSTAAPSSPAEDLPIVQEYRVLSPAAVATFIAGLASALALAHPLMLVVPLATLALAAWSLRSMAVERTAGRGLVVTGVCLAVLFLGVCLGSRLTHQAILRQRARQFADEWLQIVVEEGDLRRGHQLHISRENRLDPQVNFQQHYQTDESAANSYRAFIDKAGLKKLRSAGSDARVAFVRCVLLTRRGLAEEIVLEYRVEGRDEEFSVWITVRRTLEEPFRGTDWEIFDVTTERPLD